MRKLHIVVNHLLMRIRGWIKITRWAVTLSLSNGVRWLARILRQAQYDLRTQHLFSTSNSYY
jgi:hypothetical protein